MEENNDYHQRSLSETGMYRYKQLDKLSLRDNNGQVSKVLGDVKVMNKVDSVCLSFSSSNKPTNPLG